MFRIFPVCFLALVGLCAGASPVQAQVFGRAPFVRVCVGRGVYVRAPFVTYSNGWVPAGPPVVVEPQGQTVESLPPPQELPPQKVAPEKSAIRAMTLTEFANTFQPRGGNYEVLLINPVTKAAASVRFVLPEGTPRRVIVDPQGVEFVYSLRHFVRIHFNADGVVITSR